MTKYIRSVVLVAILLGIYSLSGKVIASDFTEYNSLSDSDKIEVLWQSYLDKNLDSLNFYMQLERLDFNKLSISNKLRLNSIKSNLSRNKSISRLPVTENISDEEALKLASEWLFIGSMTGVISPVNLGKISKAKKLLESIKKFQVKTKKEIKDLFYKTPDYAYYNNGEYKNTLKLFLFCRHDRHYPCLFMMKDIFDNPVRNSDGTLWSLPALAHSRRELPYNITNGYTPSGVHTINSVMPKANRQQAFGKFRRVILNWIPKSFEETNMSHFLPKSAQNKIWWKEASVARDVGRKWLRIHGTGNRNTDTSSSFYPHFATSGCVSTRELEYDGTDYKDQRIILNKMMEAMQIAPVFSNETSLKGVLYVIELDDKKKSITPEDLAKFGLY